MQEVAHDAGTRYMLKTSSPPSIQTWAATRASSLQSSLEHLYARTASRVLLPSTPSCLAARTLFVQYLPGSPPPMFLVFLMLRTSRYSSSLQTFSLISGIRHLDGVGVWVCVCLGVESTPLWMWVGVHVHVHSWPCCSWPHLLTQHVNASRPF